MQILEWLGTNWLAVIAIAVPVAAALYVASQSTRYFMDHRDFERDRAASDAYIARMRAIRVDDLTDDGKSDHALAEINHAGTDWLQAVNSADRLGGIFGDLYVTAVRARTAAREGRWDNTVSSQVMTAVSWSQEFVRDWPYPERRPAAMRRALERMAADAARPSLDVPLSLQIDRWMLVELPSPYRAVRRWRATVVWIRLLWHDITRGRLKNRVQSWRIDRAERRTMIAKYGKPQRR